MINGEAANTNFIIFGLTTRDLNLLFKTLKASMLPITPQMYEHHRPEQKQGVDLGARVVSGLYIYKGNCCATIIS
jgi:hypothetical protein